VIDQEIRLMIETLQPGQQILLDVYCDDRQDVEQIKVYRNEIEVCGRKSYMVTELSDDGHGKQVVSLICHSMPIEWIDRDYEIEMP